MDASPRTPDYPSTPSTPSRRLNKKIDRLKMFSQITILDGTMDGKIIVSLKIEDCSFVDDNSLALLALPDGPFVKSASIKSTFHPFVITVQNGQRIYGGSYVFGLKQIARSSDTDEHKIVYMSRALVALTIRPLVDQLKKLLEWCVNEGGCNPRWLRCLTNIRLPQKGRFVVIHLPDFKSLNKLKNLSEQEISDNDTFSINNFEQNFENANKVIIFRPLNIFPLFDYSFRYLLTQVITLEHFFLLFNCALNESQVLIVSDSYYNLMLISECLISLLNPFKWPHVYVPILPSKLGLHYLDAPTPFIMGINSRLRNFVKPNRIACYYDCDIKKMELNFDISNFIIPPFFEDLRHDLNELFNYDSRLYSDLTKSETLRRVSEIALKYNFLNDNFTCLDDIKLTQSIRMLFFNKLKKCILNNYQHYICVLDSKDQFKFDTVSYLSDQPLLMRPFLQNFVETQMFATFIDEAGKTILKKQKNEPIQNEVNILFYLDEDEADQTESLDYCQKLIEARFNDAQNINLIDLEELANSQNNSAVSTPYSPFKKRFQPTTPIQKNPNKSVLSSPYKQLPASVSAPTNWKIVETLLKEVKNKTKRILLTKMGSDEIGNPSSPEINAEDNTLITALCDLIERIWSHARTVDNNSQTNKCPFWSHVIAYFQISPAENSNRINCSGTNLDSSNDSFDQNDDQNSGGWISIKKRIDSLSQLSLDQRTFLSEKDKIKIRSIPTTLSYDYKSICDMIDIKTEVGKSRAFIRLALERKLLSKHLRTLLYNQELLQTLYKRFAFLRCEDEREQFLTHLLTLNAVDLYCFTNTFTTSSLPYTLVICAASFIGCISIVGSSNQTTEYIHIDSPHYTFKHKNLGHIYTLSLLVKPNQKVFVEQCFLRNDVTNALFKFECGKWLGKNIDDGSMERLLVGELVGGTINEHIKRSNHIRSSSIGRNWSRISETSPKEDKYSVEDLQTLLGESINQIMKLFFSEKNRTQYSNENSKINKSVQFNHNKFNSATLNKMNRIKNISNNANINMISLFFGEKKFLWIMTQVFYYGFKNRKSFRRQTFIWDYILRVQCELKLNQSTSINEQNHIDEFINLVDLITNKTDTYGKDMKFQLFIFLSLRDHKLSPIFLKLLLRQQLLQTHYESESFLRNQTLLTFLIQILNTFKEIDLKLDKNITKNL